MKVSGIPCESFATSEQEQRFQEEKLFTNITIEMGANIYKMELGWRKSVANERRKVSVATFYAQGVWIAVEPSNKEGGKEMKMSEGTMNLVVDASRNGYKSFPLKLVL